MGRERELCALVSKLDEDNICDATSHRLVKWNFQPPHEAMIKSAKRAIYHVLQNGDINDEELQSAIVGVEGLLNSRPLTYQSISPDDYIALTPNHFLLGRTATTFTPGAVDESDFNLRIWWRRVPELVRHVWQRWLH